MFRLGVWTPGPPRLHPDLPQHGSGGHVLMAGMQERAGKRVDTADHSDVDLGGLGGVGPWSPLPAPQAPRLTQALLSWRERPCDPTRLFIAMCTHVCVCVWGGELRVRPWLHP